jgi:glyoxylase-like metal-dependent hydrolase (beta-lactamase superfamily II)
MQFFINIALTMIFKQLFDTNSSTYTYIISSGKGREALIIDPVIDNTNEYLKILKDLDLKLVKVIDTHIHADHISGLNELSKQTNCSKIMGEQSASEVIDVFVKDNEKINIENIELISIYTPGHTDCSYSFLMNDRVFTGDTLLINGTGRTDFQNGNVLDQYESIFKKLLKLPEKTLVYPAHDYNGNKYSTIRDEKNNNPRLQVTSAEEYAELMNNLKLENPEMMDITVSANKKGLTLDKLNLNKL